MSMSVAVRPGLFATLLQSYRTTEGLTQQQLADFATLSVRAIRDLEHGRAERPRRDTVRLLAEALRLDPARRAEFERAARGGILSRTAGTPATPAGTHVGPRGTSAGTSARTPDGAKAGTSAGTPAGAPSDASADARPDLIDRPSSDGPRTYEYSTVLLDSLASDSGDGEWSRALNDLAAHAWRLVSVDRGVAFLERRLG
ncbi:helix-turn-helix domain-containing protein [Streptomyces sp. NPDC053431]|uniref:helix-turn-helix domain-containing protein n=1 Tax=Streptomyces sp. NPDC053431 TaxID=3365703 RepID=UPI0037D4FE3E